MDLRKSINIDKYIIRILLGAAVFYGVYWYFSGGPSNDAQERANNVASSMVESYQMAKRNGAKTDACTQASMIEGMYLGLKDEANYKQWKFIEVADCREAGIPVSP